MITHKKQISVPILNDLPSALLTKIELSCSILNKIETELQLSGDELQRMEDEGGLNQTREQLSESNNYLIASNCIKSIVPKITTINSNN